MNPAAAFSRGVGVLFGTEIFVAGLGIFNGILLARLLGPAAKGDYYILVLLPATSMVLLQLGLPQAFGFFAARGHTVGLVTKAVALTIALSIVAFLGVTIVLPFIRDAALNRIGVELVYFAFLAFPLALLVTFTTSIVMGRQAVRWYAGVNVAFSIATTMLLVGILAGVGATVASALAVYVISVCIQSVGFLAGAIKVTADHVSSERPERASYRGLFGYGLAFYPASLAGFFSYRVDGYLIAFLIADASEPLGFYSMAVGLAEMIFFFPRAVAMLFFPHVAGTPREEADRQVALVSRLTILITCVFAVLLIPGAAVMLAVLLPAFLPAFVPLVVLLPGVVALSASHVVGGYLRGIGRPGITSAVNLVALGVNVAVNLVLIPRLGIVGASAASLVSYTLTMVALTVIAARWSRTPLLAFWLPRATDVKLVITTTVGLIREVAAKSRGMSNHKRV